jgi:hypothetical protein
MKKTNHAYNHRATNSIRWDNTCNSFKSVPKSSCWYTTKFVNIINSANQSSSQEQLRVLGKFLPIMTSYLSNCGAGLNILGSVVLPLRGSRKNPPEHLTRKCSQSVFALYPNKIRKPNSNHFFLSGAVLAGQVLSHLSRAWALLALVYFSDSISCFCSAYLSPW